MDVHRRRLLVNHFSFAREKSVFNDHLINPRDSTSVLEALPGKLDIKRHSPIILYILTSLVIQQAFSKPYLVNLISKDTHLVVSKYTHANLYLMLDTG